MEKLSLTIENELIVLEQYRLTAEEWLIIRLLFLASEEENRKDYLIKYVTYAKPDFRSIIISLQDKGIVSKSYKIPERGTEFNPEDIVFNKNFTNKYLKFSCSMGRELFDNYPVTINVNGITYSARTSGNKYRDLEDMYYAYGRAIGNKPNVHRHVLELLDWAKENNLVNKGLYRFIADREWLNLEAMKDDPTINYNSIKCL